MDSDVKKIVETYKDVTRIFFCTNQTVSSRSRLTKQQKYKKDFIVDTVILDINWYVQAVYDQGCYDDAVEALGLGDNLKMVKKLGPRDTELVLLPEYRKLILLYYSLCKVSGIKVKEE